VLSYVVRKTRPLATESAPKWVNDVSLEHRSDSFTQGRGGETRRNHSGIGRGVDNIGLFVTPIRHTGHALRVEGHVIGEAEQENQRTGEMNASAGMGFEPDALGRWTVVQFDGGDGELRTGIGRLVLCQNGRKRDQGQ